MESVKIGLKNKILNANDPKSSFETQPTFSPRLYLSSLPSDFS